MSNIPDVARQSPDENDAEEESTAFARKFFVEMINYSSEIAGTVFAQDYELDDDEIAHINFVFNEFHALKNSREVEDLRRQQASARKLLKQATAALKSAVEVLGTIEKNLYASSAMIAAIPLVKSDGKNMGTDDQIDELNQSIAIVSALAEIADAAARQKAYSDGLPAFSKGRRADLPFDRLLWRLSKRVEQIIRRNGGDVALEETIPTCGTAEIARSLQELLGILGIRLEEKTLINRLIEIRQQPFPGISAN